MLGDRNVIDAVLEDYETAPITDPEKALLSYVKKVNDDCASVNQADIDALHQQGWTDQAIYDAILVCGLFNFYNRWVDASGVHEMPPHDHAMSGQRLATRGYK
ncbi:MAG: peroxidase [Acidobacteriota bacterium]|nr:peroxidase [Acidobacteriota bacterium]